MIHKIYMVLVLLVADMLTSCDKYEYKIPTDTPIIIEPEEPGESGPPNIKIGVFWPPVFDMATDAQFKALADGNVDVLQYVIPYSQAQNLTLLDKAKANNIKVSIYDARVYGSDAEITDMVEVYKNHTGLEGYYIKDEPNMAQLDEVATIYQKLVARDLAHAPHVNLFPSLAVGGLLGDIDYEADYVRAWISKVGADKLQYLSVDIYPFLADGSFRDLYYNDLDVIRKVALELGDIKTSAYLQSVGIEGAYRRPNEAELRYNMYSMLAYGIKYPVWFTYGTPDPASSGSEVFTSAILDLNGNKTDLYVPFQKLNAEVKALGLKLIEMQSQAVYHTGTTIPAGTEALPGWYFLQLVNPAEECLIAQLKNWHEGDGRNYAMIVNKSLTETKAITFTVAGWITDIGEISKASGSENPTVIDVAGDGSKTITLILKPGEGRLFGFKP
ncbi:MAG TPA: hypothetical protein PLR74_00805 [Agriterribacter sp.]|nr:hypothetical protein [Agriterribacter sp.]